MVVDDEQGQRSFRGVGHAAPPASSPSRPGGRPEISTRVPDASLAMSRVAPIVAGSRAHVLEALVAERADRLPGRTRGRCPRSTSRRPAALDGAHADDGARRAGMAGDVAQRLVHDRRAGGRSSMSGSSSTAPTSSSTSIMRVVPELLDDRARGRRRASSRSRSSGRRPKMKLRMSRIVRWRLSIARSTRRSTSSGSLRTSSGHVLERQPDAVEALDDAVVEVLADPLAFVDDREAAAPARGAARSRWRSRRGGRTSRRGAGRPRRTRSRRSCRSGRGCRPTGRAP